MIAEIFKLKQLWGKFEILTLRHIFKALSLAILKPNISIDSCNYCLFIDSLYEEFIFGIFS